MTLKWCVCSDKMKTVLFLYRPFYHLPFCLLTEKNWTKKRLENGATYNRCDNKQHICLRLLFVLEGQWLHNDKEWDHLRVDKGNVRIL